MKPDIRRKVEYMVRELESRLPEQAPIRDFVFRNPLSGYQHLPFPQALALARQTTGANSYLPLQSFRKLYRQGRITDADLKQVLSAETGPGMDHPLPKREPPYPSLEEICLMALRHPLHPIGQLRLDWEITENRALHRIHPDVSRQARQQLLARANTDCEATAVSLLWQACLRSQQHNAEYRPAEEEPRHSAPSGATRNGKETIQILERESARCMERLLREPGREYSLRGLLRGLSGEDLMKELKPCLARQLAAFLDQDCAAWPMPGREQGFYPAWRQMAMHFPCQREEERSSWHLYRDSLPEDALDTIVSELVHRELPEERWSLYLRNLVLELPGWFGMVHWQQCHSDSSANTAPVSLLDCLAVALVSERMLAIRISTRLWGLAAGPGDLRDYFRRHPAELLVRFHLFNSSLPEHLSARAEHLLAQDPALVPESEWQQTALMILSRQSGSHHRHPDCHAGNRAWPLFLLAQHLGWSANELNSLDQNQRKEILNLLNWLNPDRMGYIWLRAYEHHYRQQAFLALQRNAGRGRWQTRPQRPCAQVVFCMDDREESFRRHLEEVDPNMETLGTAGFFGMAIHWKGVDARTRTTLCPSAMIPAHEIRERPLMDQEAANIERQQRRHWRDTLTTALIQEGRRNPLLTLIFNIALAPLALIDLCARVFQPELAAACADRVHRWSDVPVQTELVTDARCVRQGTPQMQPQLGFTLMEQVDRVEELLRGIGLAQGFSPFVILMGHGSSSLNNPHLAAYDCGACGGHHGGPNARVFACLANKPKIRALLAERGIDIPADTRFIGAEHDTGNQDIQWYDLDLVPPDQRRALDAIRDKLQQARLKAALECCHRLGNAPRESCPATALRYLRRRCRDISEISPEPGHAGHAIAIVGRRSLTRGTFLDRRAFLVSHDPTQDEQGLRLEKTLSTVLPVLAGINLEYYFSTVDNGYYGCGSKVLHNICAMLGVMEGSNSDLRAGLPRQMVDMHEAMRLQLLVEASTEVLDKIRARLPILAELVGNGWMHLASIVAETGEISVFDPATGWSPWQNTLPFVRKYPDSASCHQGRTGTIAPSLLDIAVNRYG